MSPNLGIPQSALDDCSSLPIRAPGQIQSHGLLLVVDEISLRILQLSDNAPSIIGRDVQTLLNGTLAEIFGPKATSDFRELIATIPPRFPRHGVVTLPVGDESHQFEVFCHRRAEGIILELEPNEHPTFVDETSAVESFEHLAAVVRDLRHGNGVEGFASNFVDHVRSFLHYDRVLIYRFDEHGHGEVIAESRDPELEPYLGLWFPHTDVPASAREMGLENPVRLVVDYQAPASSLVPTQHPVTRQSTDLSPCHLRAVHPHCIEFYASMDVRASMVVSIVVEGKLWGFLSCHHRSPRRPSVSLRSIGHVVAEFLSTQISVEEKANHLLAQRDASLAYERMVQAIGASDNWMKGLKNAAPRLLEALRSSGLSIVRSDEILSFGSTPSDAELRPLLRMIEIESTDADTDVYACRDIGRREPFFRGMERVASGVLSLHLADDTWLLWFRPEISAEIRWAGDPRQGLSIADGIPQLSPRGSFMEWVETVHGVAKPWSNRDLAVARTILNYLSQYLINQKLRTEINDRHRAEQERDRRLAEIESAHAQIERQAAQLRVQSEELMRSKELAEQASKSKSAFLANMSHELRTPLNAVIGFADLMLAGRVGALGEKQGEYIKTISEQGRHLLRLLNDVLDLAKVEAGREDLEPSRFNLAQMLRSSIQAIRGLSIQNRIQLVDDIQDVGMVVADKRKIQQVVINLLSNACKFTPADGSVRLCSRQEGETVVVSVVDTGIGIRKEDQARIFEEFEQLESSFVRRFKGSGLGLAIARRLIEMHGGRLWVESDAGMGSTFHFTIAVSNELSAPESSERAIPKAPLPSESHATRLLIVDDDPINLKLFQEILEDRFTIVSVATPNEALTRVRQSPPDLCLIDIQLSEMDGMDLLRNIRQVPGCEEIPAIAVTAHAMKGDRERFIEAGFNIYISKPIDVNHLVEQLSVLVEDSKPRPS